MHLQFVWFSSVFHLEALNIRAAVYLRAPLCVFAQVCDLLDLLGGSQEPLQPSSSVGGSASAPLTAAPTSAGGDLLDLLGGFEPTPLAPGEFCQTQMR